MTKEERQKYDEAISLEYKTRKIKTESEKNKAMATHQKALLQPNIKKNLISWTDKYKNGTVYEGTFGKEKCFEIKRGIMLFSLKVIHKELKYNKNNSSMELIKLQEKANKVLWENVDFLLKFKPVS